MDSVEKLTAAITLVEEARGVPLSASCVVHRAEMLEILDEARESLPTDFESARKIIDTREAIIEEARVSAEQMIAIAREDVAQMVNRPLLFKLHVMKLVRFWMMLVKRQNKKSKRLKST